MTEPTRKIDLFAEFDSSADQMIELFKKGEMGGEELFDNVSKLEQLFTNLPAENDANYLDKSLDTSFAKLNLALKFAARVLDSLSENEKQVFYNCFTK